MANPKQSSETSGQQGSTPAGPIAIIGTGRIGRAWAIVFARAGLSVKLHDADRAMLDNALPAIRDSLADLARFNLIEETADVVAARIPPCPTLADAVSDAELVQE